LLDFNEKLSFVFCMNCPYFLLIFAGSKFAIAALVCCAVL
jgi:hypothetical protein